MSKPRKKVVRGIKFLEQEERYRKIIHGHSAAEKEINGLRGPIIRVWMRMKGGSKTTPNLSESLKSYKKYLKSAGAHI